MTTDERMDLFTAAAERERGMTRAAAGAGIVWAEDAYAWLRLFLRHHSEFFPDTDLREGPEPPDRRAWGPLIRRAKKDGLIVPTGEYRPRSRGHCTPGAVYRSLIS